MYDSRMIEYRKIIGGDGPSIEALLDKVFGADRQKKTVYRLREGVEPIIELGLIAMDGNELRGAIAFWPVIVQPVDKAVEARRGLLLGPLAVDPVHRGEGIGIRLMEDTLEKATEMGHQLVILVGDLDYYERVGFSRNRDGVLRLPGPVEANRILVRALVPGADAGLDGVVMRPGDAGTRADPENDRHQA